MKDYRCEECGKKFRSERGLKFHLKTVHKQTVWRAYGDEIKQLRERGYSLQAIGDRFEITREGVRQLLQKHYGTTEMPFLTRNQVAKIVGCSGRRLSRLEKRGILHPLHHGRRYLYALDDVKKVFPLILRKH
jgi:hypothetical protein